MEVMSSLLQLLPLLPLLQSGGYLGTMVLMAHVSVQVSMSLYGFVVPLGKISTDMRKRREVFEIIHPYILSANMEEVAEAGEQQIELWLESFTSERIALHDTQLLYKAVFPILFPE